MTKGKEKEVWRLELEGEAEKHEAAAPWNGVKGVSVNPEGESHHERGRLWRMLGKDHYIQGMWEYFSFERLKAKKFMKDAEKEKQEVIQGHWQRGSPAKERLEQVKCCSDPR